MMIIDVISIEMVQYYESILFLETTMITYCLVHLIKNILIEHSVNYAKLIF